MLGKAWCSACSRGSALTRSWKGKLGLCAGALAVAAGLTFGLSSAGAQGNVYVVQPGDTLTLLAARFYGNGALWPTIYNANVALIGANPDLIRVGAQLVIPNSVSAAQAQTQAVSQAARSYTVVPGDVLNEIAFKVYGNHALWPAIYAANRNLIGPNPNIIKEGTLLSIPANPQVTVAQQNVARPAQQQVQLVYVTVPVQQAQPQVQAQAQAPGQAIFIEPGRQIALPVGASSNSQFPIAGYHVVRSGETLMSVSRQVYGSDQFWRAIYEANAGVIGGNPMQLPVGATLVIPK
jgi:nucleoid-associated protein YgaU